MSETRGARAGAPLPSEIPEDIRALSFEAALAELEALVEQLERGELSLEDSLRDFERGVQLARSCQQALKDAELKVQQLVEQNGQLRLEGFEPAE